MASLFILFATALIGAVLYAVRHNTENLAVFPVNQEVKEERPEPASPEKNGGYANPDALIGVHELHEKIFSDPGIFTIDTRGRTYRVFKNSYPIGHIPGAAPLLYKRYCHPTYAGRMASPLQLQNILREIGVRNDSCIVLYGNDGLQARLYWAIKMYGHTNVKILDGGFDIWKEAGYEIATANSTRPSGDFEFDLTQSNIETMLATIDEVKASVGDRNSVILDARSPNEHQTGSVPGSENIHCQELLNTDGTFKPAPELEEIFMSKQINRDKKVIVYSNNGVRSSLVWFALSELLGYPNVKNYDGSYQEWVNEKAQMGKDQKGNVLDDQKE